MIPSQQNELAAPAHVPAVQGGGMEGDELNIRHTLDLLLSGKWIILGFTLAGLLIGVTYAMIAQPVYQADGLVQVEQDKKSGGNSELSEISSMLSGTPVRTEAELQLLKSRMVLAQVVERLNLQIQYSPRRFPLIGNAIARLNRNASKPVQPPSWLSGYAWGGEKLEISTFDVPEQLANRMFYLVATASGYELRDVARVKIAEGKVGEMLTTTYADAPIKLFVREFVASPGTEFTLVSRAMQNVLKSLGSRISVAERGRQSGIISISVSADDPVFAAKIVNSVEDAYLRQNVERRSAEAQRSLDFLERQIPVLKDKVNLAQQRLNNYQLRNGSVDVTKETDILLQRAVEVETARMTLHQQREEALQRFTPDHPYIKAIDDKLKSFDGEFAKLRVNSEKLPTTQQEIFGLKRDLEVANELYTAMLNSVQQLQVTKAGTVGNVRIVDYALPSLAPSAPRKAFIAEIALVIGAFLGVAFVLIQRVLLRGVDDPAEVESRLGLPAYGSVPFTSLQRDLEDQLSKPGAVGVLNLLSSKSSSDLAVEALRSVRNSLHFLMLESPNNVVMFTGPAPGIGKSFVTSNLGALVALSGKRAVVVDADLRLGHLNKYLGVEAKPGVSDYVAGDCSYEDLLRPTGTDGFSLITNGTKPPNPAEVLLHERFAGLVERLSQEFDYVIIDTPPSLLVADAAVVGRLAGCTLLVLKSAEHPMREIEECHRRLVQAGVQVRGVVFNQVGRRVGSYGYGGYGYSYNRYYKYD